MGVTPSCSVGRYIVATAFGVCWAVGSSTARADGDQASLVSTFQRLEQKLMDAIAPGDKAVWDSVMDDTCVVTSEEGQLSSKEDFLRELKPLPSGLAGGIAVRDLTVQPFASFAIVRYEGDEWEQVFGQRLTTKYRMTDAFRRDGTGWKLVASHTSLVTADPPAQSVDKSHWSDLVGDYQLLPDGWVFHVELRDGVLYGGRSPGNLRPLIPLTPVAFVLEGSLGELLFDTDGGGGRASRIVELRKFEPLVWTRVARRTP
jgi:ketosteroid isomerase-like protein